MTARTTSRRCTMSPPHSISLRRLNRTHRRGTSIPPGGRNSIRLRRVRVHWPKVLTSSLHGPAQNPGGKQKLVLDLQLRQRRSPLEPVLRKADDRVGR
jgi:hypothetical protein